MRRLTSFFCVILCYFVLNSCQDEVVSTSKNTGLFDIEKYIDSLILVQHIYPSVNRTIVSGENREQLTMENFDVTECLEYLKTFGINKPQWYDKYKITRLDQSVIYEALDADLNVQKMEVLGDKNGSSGIQISYHTGTFLSSSEKEISFIPNQSLRINSINDSRFSASTKMEVTWNFKP